MSGSLQSDLVGVFNDTACDSPRSKNRKRAHPLPISLRVSAQEKAQLQEMAGALAISAYIRQRLFGDEVARRPKRYQKKSRQPQVDTQEIARLLGLFGRSELACSMLALSLAAQAGNLQISREVEDKIDAACEDIHTIKLALILALGVKPREVRG